MSRALSGYSVVTFPKAKKDGLVTAFAKGASQAPAAVSGILLCWLAGGFFWILLTGGLVMALAAGAGAAAAFLWYLPHGSSGIWRNYRGSGRIFSSNGGAFYDRSSGTCWIT